MTEDKITIKDFNCVCYLVYKGFKYSEIIPVTERRGKFVFQNPTPELREEMKKNWNRETTVEPRAFIETFKTVKAHYDDYLTNRKSEEVAA